MTGHIQAVLKRYPMTSVDVVNEALAPPGEEIRADGYRPSIWLDAFGVNYIDLAFHAARAAAPGVQLVYNDWGFEQGAAENDRFRARTLRLLDGLLKRRVPVDALGIQGHLSAFGNKVDQRKLAAFLREIEARGLGILITELDVEDTGGPSDIAARDRAAADEARRFLDVALDSRATKAVLTWNLSDRYVDPPDEWKLKLLNWRYRKTPYDAQMRKKPLWQALAQSFAGRRI
jgi:endo-1,4-beta-xylanase